MQTKMLPPPNHRSETEPKTLAVRVCVSGLLLPPPSWNPAAVVVLRRKKKKKRGADHDHATVNPKDDAGIVAMATPQKTEEKKPARRLRRRS